MNQPPRLLQFGSGVFLRGFVDWMVERLQRAGQFDGSVILSKLTPGGSLEAYERSGGRYTHVLRGMQDGVVVDTAETIRCVKQWIQPFDQWEEFLRLAHLPSLKIIVSNSTEAGIRYDTIEPPSSCPTSFPARLCLFLHERFRRFGGDPGAGLIHLPCELIEDNGQRLREIVLRHATDWGLDPGFAHWIEDHCPFVDTLVDRIVAPPSGPEQEELARRHECDPALLNSSEPYSLFVLRGPREEVEKELPLAAAGLAEWTDDLAPWRERKVRILNGAHTALVGTGVLVGLETVLDCTQDPLVSRYLKRLLHEEIVPAAPGKSDALKQYADEILERFRNPFLRHRLTDIGLNSLAKVEVRLFPSIRDFHQRTGRAPELCCLALAALLRFMKASATDENGLAGEAHGRSYRIRDEANRLTTLQDAWQRWDLHRETGEFVEQVLQSTALWNRPFRNLPAVSSAVSRHLTNILESGAERAVATALES